MEETTLRRVMPEHQERGSTTRRVIPDKKEERMATLRIAVSQSLLEWTLTMLPACYPIVVTFSTDERSNYAQTLRSFFTLSAQSLSSSPPTQAYSPFRAQSFVTSRCTALPACMTLTSMVGVYPGVVVGWRCIGRRVYLPGSMEEYSAQSDASSLRTGVLCAE